MERHGEEGAIFRYPQNQLSIEIQRMALHFLPMLRQAEPSNNRDKFRFCDNPFFLKFVPTIAIRSIGTILD